jgi:formyltetrahydrofolate-dependent phosphoribosylglycinamide formyltransferase
MIMRKVAIFASGAGTNAENIIKYFIDNKDIEVALVLSNKVDAGVHSRAAKYGIPSFTFSDKEFNEGNEVLKKLVKFDVDFIVLAGFLLKIPRAIIAAFPDRIINIHPALLPKFGGKGMYGHRVHEAVVAAGEKESGITIHYVNENYDDGQIIFQAKFPVLQTDTVEDVEQKIHLLEYKHFPEVVEKLLKSENFVHLQLNINSKSMEKFAASYYSIFEKATNDYHQTDNVDSPIQNPYNEDSIASYLYLKNWIDTVQWHLEDIIRNPDIDPVEALKLKRRIDKSNQERTDIVELIDNYFLEKYGDVQIQPDATINTESPAWAIDRLSILELKIFHIEKEIEREDIADIQREKCVIKRQILHEQREDLMTALNELIDDISKGRKYMKVYRQMKMYNDPMLNPVLYGKK